MKKSLLFAAFTFLAGTAFAQAAKPNIIFLMSDDQTTYSMGCYGNKDVQTPHLDKLAKDGIVFDRHYTSTAICMASRATVMTGMYEYKTGTNFDHGDMTKSIWAQSYPVLLRKGGYRTAFAGKFGFEITDGPDGKRLPLPANDFDSWGGMPHSLPYKTAGITPLAKYANEFPHSTLAYGAFARDFIKESVQSNKPFCLSISFKAPHRPTSPDPRFNEVYKEKIFTKPANFGREFGEHFSKQSKQDRQYERFEAWRYDTDYDEVMATYHQQIYAIDVALGMIRTQLEESSLANNTVIIYTSDNGFFCGSHGYGSKVLPYEESSRVPLIIYDPRDPNSGKGLRSQSLTANIDFAPTILALAGLEAPAPMDGKNIMKVYKDPKASIHDSIALINVWGKQPTRNLSIVSKDFKYIFWSYGGEGFEACEELYHLSKDPLELKNMASNPEYAAQLETMRQQYDSQIKTWAEQAVTYNSYQHYSTLFDRNKSWDEKLQSVSSKKTNKKTNKKKKKRRKVKGTPSTSLAFFL